MTHPNKQEFWEWAYGDLLANTTRGVLAEYIVAKALGICDTKRVEWDQYDLEIDGVKVEVKSAAYVQTWKQPQLSKIAFGIRPAKGWDARTNTSAASAQRSADVYVFCLLKAEDREHIDPLDVEQWTFWVLPTSELNRKVPAQKTIRLRSLIALHPHECTYDELKDAIGNASPRASTETPGELPTQSDSMTHPGVSGGTVI
ncbi:hypothetical protein [Mycolicibacterium elephantis]|uniref:hypothetical protein n=1 Tax=Mycolicibacterium elephantis TaxID=81858 RepID=UPI000AFB696C|nr:hypothetical protein [Mycolicibacterium elephantis]